MAGLDRLCTFYFLLFMFSMVIEGRSTQDIKLWESKCSSNLTGNKGNTFSECQFLNGECTKYNSGEKIDDKFDQSTEYIFGNNSFNDGAIDFENESLEFKHNEGADSNFHSLGQWELYNSRETKLIIKIERKSENYEEIFIDYETPKGSYTLDNRQLSNCNSKTTSVSIGKANYIKMKVKVLNDYSDYTITITEDSSNTSLAKKIWKTIFIIGLICPSCCIILLFIKIFYYIITKRRRDMLNKENRKNPRRLKYIKTVIDNMRTGQFKDLDTAYEQKSCVICIEDFSDDSNILITNEGSHVFHAVGLTEWFEQIKANSRIRCPLCSSIITNAGKETINVISTPQQNLPIDIEILQSSNPLITLNR